MRKGLLVSLLLLLLAFPAAAGTIDMDFRDAPLVDVFQILGELGGMNVLVDPSVTGQVSFNLRDLTVMQALDLVARSSGYRFEIVDNTLVVASPERIRTEFTDTEVEFVQLEQADIRSAREILALMAPDIRVFVDESTRLLILHGTRRELELAKQVLQQYDTEVKPPERPVAPAPEVAAPAVVEEEPEDPTRTFSVGVEFVDGSEIVEYLTGLYPDRTFRWSSQMGLISGRALPEEIEHVRELVADRDKPQFTLRGIISGDERNRALIEWQGETRLVDQGEVLAGWTIAEIANRSVTFTRADQELDVVLGR